MIEDFNTQIMEQETSATNYVVVFSDQTENYCIGMVDMVNSTKMAAELGGPKMSIYYQIFLNFMSKILSHFGNKILEPIKHSKTERTDGQNLGISWNFR